MIVFYTKNATEKNGFFVFFSKTPIKREFNRKGQRLCKGQKIYFLEIPKRDFPQQG